MNHVPGETCQPPIKEDASPDRKWKCKECDTRWELRDNLWATEEAWIENDKVAKEIKAKEKK